MKKKIVYIVFALILIIVFCNSSFGRYVYYKIKDSYLASKKFYFNSDKLTSNHREYVINNWSGVDTYQFLIGLNSSKNNYEHANSDINYEISYTCSDNANCSISKNEGTIYESSSNDSFVATIAPSVALKNNDEIWVDIEAKSTYPYKKTLGAKFILKVGIPGISYEIKDEKNSPYFNLSVTNTTNYYLVKEAFGNYNIDDRIDYQTYESLSENDKSKCALPLIKLEFDPKEVILDLTSSAFLNKEDYTVTTIDGYEYINSISFRINLEASEVVKFYKANTSKDYTYPLVNENSIVDFSYSQ
ncbi:MAG TPA: hypothetical protein DDY61_00485 [Ruminococcaceae bacterium]|nr:hypothetical protein [Oscillospiraceae bacterium]